MANCNFMPFSLEINRIQRNCTSEGKFPIIFLLKQISNCMASTIQYSWCLWIHNTNGNASVCMSMHAHLFVYSFSPTKLTWRELSKSNIGCTFWWILWLLTVLLTLCSIAAQIIAKGKVFNHMILVLERYVLRAL